MEWRRKNKLIDEPIEVYLEKLFNEEIEAGFNLRICIGSDSQKHGGVTYKFATAIVIERKLFFGNDENGKPTYIGKGAMVVGGTFTEKMKASTNAKKHREIEILNQRMLKEVSASIEIGYKLAPLFEKYGIPLEIHADINQDPRWESNVALNSAIGYIKGMGYEFKMKPEAYAASTGADNLC